MLFCDVLGKPFANKHTKLQITGKVVNDLVAEGRAALPYEYSALLAGCGSRITCHYPAVRAPRMRNAFVWDGRELIETLKQMHHDQTHWLGLLHTHPTAPPVPSAQDTANWHYPQLSFWILSFSGGQPQLQAYQWRDGRFHLYPYEQL